MVKTDIKQIQKRLLEMAIQTRNILEKNNIPYMLSFGTLLGAVRHKGYIPWDDDFDIWLFEEDYEKAIQVLRMNLPEDMFLEDEMVEPLYFHSWAHVKDKHSIAHTEQFAQDDAYQNKGIVVDLYKLHRCLEKEAADYLCKENNLYLMRRKDKGLISMEEYESRINKRIKVDCISETNKEVFVMITTYKHKLLTMDEVYPFKRYQFEGELFWGPNDADEILKNVYGNYMELPPKEKRVGHYDWVKWVE